MLLKFQKKAVIALLAIIGLVLADSLFLHSWVVGRVYDAASQPLVLAYQKITAAAGFTKVFIHTARVETENIRLEQANQQLLAELSKLKEVENENAVLRVRLNIPAPSNRNLIFAKIFNLRGGEQLSEFVIDKGASEGVETGMAVVSPENVLAGIVGKVYEHEAVILMPQSKNLSINVVVQDRKVLARSHGTGNQALLDFVTTQDDIQKDDIVVTAGFDKIPAAIPVFKVSDINVVSGSLFKQVTVVPLFDALTATRVFVIKKH